MRPSSGEDCSTAPTMDREQALDALTSRTVSTRLAGARALSSVAQPGDVQRLRSIRRSEPVPWIRNALDGAINRASLRSDATSPGSASPEAEPAATTDDLDSAELIHAASLQEASERFVHELRRPLGRARLYAKEEISEYETSRTYRELNRLKHFLDGIENLGTAAGAPSLEEVDLGSLLSEEGSALGETIEALTVVVEGSANQPIATDPALVRLAVSNALKNATESAVDPAAPGRITISWGITGSEVYVAVFDNGIGVTEGADLFEIGATSKRGHIGLGLAIARQASRSLGGDCTLVNLEADVTRFEMRFPLVVME